MEPKLTHLCYCFLLFLPLLSQSAIANPSSSPNHSNSINFIVSSCAPRVTLLSASNASRLSPAKSAVTKTG
uniref:Uncharacterized protein n=1 Tax=Brassica oleracea TaxID=3712 RepID=A0A3P6CZS7_BRAOL|nr:unnamed protein product [Brassica oleracea]